MKISNSIAPTGRLCIPKDPGSQIGFSVLTRWTAHGITLASVTRMSTRLITQNWTVLKRRLKQKYTQLTEADLAYIESKDEELLDRLQQCLGMSRIEIAWLV